MVYLLHFSEPYGHAKHYTGSTADDRLADRLAEHVAGSGANLTRHAVIAGVRLTLARTWPGGRETEARLKYRNGIKTGVKTGMAKYCPICKGA